MGVVQDFSLIEKVILTNYHVVGSNIIQIEFYREGELQTHNADNKRR